LCCENNVHELNNMKEERIEGFLAGENGREQRSDKYKNTAKYKYTYIFIHTVYIKSYRLEWRS
jgi:hypothetical protein